MPIISRPTLKTLSTLTDDPGIADISLATQLNFGDSGKCDFHHRIRSMLHDSTRIGKYKSISGKSDLDAKCWDILESSFEEAVLDPRLNQTMF